MERSTRQRKYDACKGLQREREGKGCEYNRYIGRIGRETERECARCAQVMRVTLRMTRESCNVLNKVGESRRDTRGEVLRSLVVSRSPFVFEGAGQVALVQLQHPLHLGGQLRKVSLKEVNLNK